MASWRMLLSVGILASVSCFLTGQNVQAQTLFERLGQVFTPDDAPAADEAADTSVPEVVIPEALPAPSSPPTTRVPAQPAYSGPPTLGATVDPLNDQIVRQRRLPVRSGAMVTAIVQGSPADRAGLPLGAVIVALDGRRIDTPAHLVAAIRTSPTDRPAEISYYDGDRLYRKKVYLVGDAVASAPATQPAPVRRVPNSQDPAYREPQPLNRGPSLEQQLGGGGQRPVLGRVGQLLDGLVAPASGSTPLAPQLPIADETTILREQVSLLQQELAALRARLSAVEKQLEATPPVR